MSDWYVVREFRTKHFRVVLDCEPERDPDISWMEPEDLEKLNSGEWHNVTFRVRVLYHGREIGADHLGNSVYANVENFACEHVGARKQSGSYFADMIKTAIGEARKELCNLPRMRCA